MGRFLLLYIEDQLKLDTTREKVVIHKEIQHTEQPTISTQRYFTPTLSMYFVKILSPL